MMGFPYFCEIQIHFLFLALLSFSLPEFFVVPASLADQDLKQYAVSFADQRIPVST